MKMLYLFKCVFQLFSQSKPTPSCLFLGSFAAACQRCEVFVSICIIKDSFTAKDKVDV